MENYIEYEDYEIDDNPEATKAANAIVFELFDQAKEQMFRDVSALASPSDISFGRTDCLKKESHFKEDDEIIFYMILDYPIRFSCCHINDFREAYLNARTDTKVETGGFGPWKIVEYVFTDCTSFAALNKCVPIFRTTLYKLPEKIETINDPDISRPYIKCLFKGRIAGYLDYLIGKAIASKSIDLKLKQAIDKFQKYVKLPDVQQKRIKAVCSRYAKVGISSIYPYLSPYFITTWDEKNGFTDKWMFFDDFVEEAKRIINGKHPCQNYLEEYPELKKLVDIDTLYIFEMWVNYETHINFDFLYQDWFFYNNQSDNNCIDFQDKDFKIKSREKAYQDHLYSLECQGELPETEEEEARDKKRFYESHKTTWGYKKELDPEIMELTYKPTTWD